MKRKSHRRIIIFILILIAVFLVILLLAGGDDEDSTDSGSSASASTYESEQLDIEGLRDYYTDTEKASDTVVFVYMIGSNLESEDGAATSDLDEMKDAQLGDSLKIVLETGGASKWYTDGIIGGEDQRWCIDRNGMKLVGDDGEKCMTEKSTLTDFISWGVEKYPADRYMLIVWDHGGGTMSGFGNDEVRDNGGLSIADMSDAINSTGVKFDMVGFDACLMGTVETAYAFEPFADYLIASEETEPGNGWYYTDFLTELAQDPSVDTVTLGKKIINDYGSYYDNEDVTLSLLDLREIPYVYEKTGEYLRAAENTIKKDNSEFASMSQARSKACSYSDGDYDQIDMIDLVQRTDFEGKDDIIAAIKSCVKYHNNSSITGSNGLAMYFPYTDPDSYSSTETVLDDIGYDVPAEFYDYFLSIMAGGQDLFESSNTMMNPAETDYSDEDWYQNHQADFDYGDGYGELYLDETDDGYVLKLSDDEWDLITDIQISVMIEMNGGYIDMGSDNVGNVTDDGDLLVDFNGEWISIDGTPVAFCANKTYDNGDGTVFSGTVSAMLNGETPIELYLEWEPLAEDASEDAEQVGHVLGYNEVDEENGTEAKGLRQLRKGDVLSFQYDCYDENGDYVDTEELMDPVTVDSEDKLEVSYADISDLDASYWATLYDIYRQQIDTEAIEVTSE